MALEESLAGTGGSAILMIDVAGRILKIRILTNHTKIAIFLAHLTAGLICYETGSIALGAPVLSGLGCLMFTILGGIMNAALGNVFGPDTDKLLDRSVVDRLRQ